MVTKITDICLKIGDPLLKIIQPHRSNFKPIYLGWSLTETPIRTTGLCDLRLLLLKSSKLGLPRPAPISGITLLDGSTFCGFRFCERASLIFPRVVFQFYDQTRQMENERSCNSKLFPGLRLFSSDFSIDEGLSREALQMA
ncbi:hypothetical protein AVEN_196160-1 [Araneus ventricosus]|uniref:Uncharacterized protein n=1 Tax=Araneus ventricosus TaxID=182803 RepID=A0A4Y2PJY3_ARAVE|nr:hypothetical protein AVEN_196160-1 [Araneus ventricosus]